MSDTGVQDQIEIKTLRKKFARACKSVAAVAKKEKADTGKFTYHYSKLDDVLGAVKDALEPENLVLMQPVSVREGMLFVDVMVVDLDTGQYLMFGGMGHNVERDPQAMGSAITYARRYTLTSLFAM